jgi:tetraacyldisaccharide-1-P 4'-kinase
MVTTEKDLMRLPASMRTEVHVHSVRAAFEDDAGLDAFLAPLVAKARR